MNYVPFEQFPVLQTDRLTLSQLKKENVAHLLEITSFNERATNETQLDELLQKTETQFQDKTGITWGLYLGEEIIGTVGFYRGFKNEEGEIGYVIREKFRRKGYLMEAANKVIEFGFNQLELKEIGAFTPDYNHASIGLLRKLGFSETNNMSGVHRKWLLNKT